MAEILQAPAGFNEQDLIRLGKLNDMIQQGTNPYEITTFDRTHLSSEIIENFDALEGQTVTIAGRMMSRRVMGKASFAHVLDRDGQIQIFVRRDDVGEDSYKEFKGYDIGDIVGVTVLPSAPRPAKFPSPPPPSSC